MNYIDLKVTPEEAADLIDRRAAARANKAHDDGVSAAALLLHSEAMREIHERPRSKIAKRLDELSHRILDLRRTK